MAKLSGMSKKDCEKHLATLADLLSTEEKGPPTQKRGHLLTYATIISANSVYADFLTRRNLINALTKQLKDANHIDTYELLLFSYYSHLSLTVLTPFTQ